MFWLRDGGGGEQRVNMRGLPHISAHNSFTVCKHKYTDTANITVKRCISFAYNFVSGGSRRELGNFKNINRKRPIRFQLL